MRGCAADFQDSGVSRSLPASCLPPQMLKFLRTLHAALVCLLCWFLQPSRSNRQRASQKRLASFYNASQFFIGGELCRRGYAAVVTLGNTPDTDILCSNIAGTKFVYIQVKTFVPGSRTCTVGKKAERDFGENFFWILGGIPKPDTNVSFEYYIIPASVTAKSVVESNQLWLKSPGKKGQDHKANDVRNVYLPPCKSSYLRQAYLDRLSCGSTRGPLGSWISSRNN